MHIMYFDICAGFNLIVVLVAFYTKKALSLQQNRIYAAIIWLSVITVASDLLNQLSMLYPASYPRWSLYLSAYSYFLFHNLTPFCCLLYSISLTGVSLKRLTGIMKSAIYGPLAVLLLLILSNPFTGAVFTYSGIRNYSRGSFLWILYILAFYYLLFAIIYICFIKNIISLKRKIIVSSFFVFGSITVLIQFVVPQLVLENFSISLCIMLLFLTIQKPGEMLDEVTGVFNRNTFSSMLKMKLRNNDSFYLTILHIEDLKLLTNAIKIENVNQLLRNVAQYMEKQNRRGVYGIEPGDFGLISDFEDFRIMRNVLEGIQQRFQEPWICDNMEINLSFRACIIHCPNEADSIDGVFEYRDHLQGQKKTGPVISWAKDMDLRDKGRFLIVEGRIAQALKENGFEVYYQPVFSVSENRFTSAEALVRLYDERLGFIPPDEFIPIAEESGDILAIGTLVFESVCMTIKECSLAEKGISSIAVNLSVVQCMQENLAGQLLTILNRYGLQPSWIKLEITETAAVNSPKILHRNVERLNQKGIKFSLDDFGTGYSNIVSIAELPLDTIKLDKSMIWASEENEKSKIILETSVAMVKKMKMSIVAEGVETASQAEELKRLGVDYLQGYYYSRPVNLEQFLKLTDGNGD